MSVLRRPPLGNGMLYLFGDSDTTECGIVGGGQGAILRAAQVEALDAAAVVHHAVFINSHRHLQLSCHTRSQQAKHGCDAKRHAQPDAANLHHGVVAAMGAEFTGRIHANLEAGVALEHKRLHSPDHLAPGANDLYAHLQQNILHGEICRHHAHAGRSGQHHGCCCGLGSCTSSLCINVLQCIINSGTGSSSR